VGIAPGVTVCPVKVLNSQGSGNLSDVIAGINYVAFKGFKVANMSLGVELSATADPTANPMYTAISDAVASGVTFAVAAGNSGKDAKTFIPACYDEVIAVSAMIDTDGLPGALGAAADIAGGAIKNWGTDDTFVYFSNFGAKVAIAAPGVEILSTYKGSAYAKMSGTSMASPHVAGAVALYLAQYPTATPADVKAGLIGLGVPQARSDGFTGDPDSSAEPLLNASGALPVEPTSPTTTTIGSSNG
jgi:subtilisin